MSSTKQSTLWSRERGDEAICRSAKSSASIYNRLIWPGQLHLCKTAVTDERRLIARSNRVETWSGRLKTVGESFLKVNWSSSLVPDVRSEEWQTFRAGVFAVFSLKLHVTRLKFDVLDTRSSSTRVGEVGACWKRCGQVCGQLREDIKQSTKLVNNCVRDSPFPVRNSLLDELEGLRDVGKGWSAEKRGNIQRPTACRTSHGDVCLEETMWLVTRNKRKACPGLAVKEPYFHYTSLMASLCGWLSEVKSFWGSVLRLAADNAAFAVSPSWLTFSGAVPMTFIL